MLVHCFVFLIRDHIYNEIGAAAEKISRLTEIKEATKSDHDLYHTSLKQWETWGLIALLTPLAALVMMVLKVPAQSGF